MSYSQFSSLREAYFLIKAKRRTQAGEMLKRYLAENPRNADAWWLMAHAASNPDVKRHCLENVLLINPRHTQARIKLTELQMQQRAFQPPFFTLDDGLEEDGTLFAPRPSYRAAKRQTGTQFSFESTRPIVFDTGTGTLSHRLATQTVDRIEPDQQERTERLIGVIIIGIGLALLFAALLYVADQQGWLPVGVSPSMTELSIPASDLESPET